MVRILNKFGRIIIPKKLRKKLGIKLETLLNLDNDGDCIIIKPIINDEPIIEKGSNSSDHRIRLLTTCTSEISNAVF